MKISSLAAGLSWIEISAHEIGERAAPARSTADASETPGRLRAMRAAPFAAHRQRRGEPAEHEQRHVCVCVCVSRTCVCVDVCVRGRVREHRGFRSSPSPLLRLLKYPSPPRTAHRPSPPPYSSRRPVSRSAPPICAAARCCGTGRRRAGRRGRGEGVLGALAAAADGRSGPCCEDFLLADADGVAAVRHERRRPAAAHAGRDAVGAAVAARRVARVASPRRPVGKPWEGEEVSDCLRPPAGSSFYGSEAEWVASAAARSSSPTQAALAARERRAAPPSPNASRGRRRASGIWSTSASGRRRD